MSTEANNLIKPTIHQTCLVKGVLLFNLHTVADFVRGHLTVGTFANDVPFVPARYFITYGIPSIQTRGEHAHRKCHQFMTCPHGGCFVTVDDGCNRQEIWLNHPAMAIYVPPMIWTVEYNHTRDSVLLVFASEPYDADDYIRDYSEFRSSPQ